MLTEKDIIKILKEFKFHFVGGLISKEGFEDLAKIIIKKQKEKIAEYEKRIDEHEQRIEDLETTLFNAGILTKISKYL